jgi:hypothetical protein
MNYPSKNSISPAESEIGPLPRRLRRCGEIVSFSSKAFDLLNFLVADQQRFVFSNEIPAAVWEGRCVEESNLAVQGSNLCKARRNQKLSGRTDKALELLEKAYWERDPLLVPIKVYPPLESLREEPRFVELLKKMNLV